MHIPQIAEVVHIPGIPPSARAEPVARWDHEHHDPAHRAPRPARDRSPPDPPRGHARGAVHRDPSSHGGGGTRAARRRRRSRRLAGLAGGGRAAPPRTDRRAARARWPRGHPQRPARTVRPHIRGPGRGRRGLVARRGRDLHRVDAARGLGGGRARARRRGAHRQLVDHRRRPPRVRVRVRRRGGSHGRGGHGRRAAAHSARVRRSRDRADRRRRARCS